MHTVLWMRKCTFSDSVVAGSPFQKAMAADMFCFESACVVDVVSVGNCDLGVVICVRNIKDILLFRIEVVPGEGAHYVSELGVFSKS